MSIPVKLKTMRFKKKYLLFVLLPTLIVFGYWFKIQMGVNLFDLFSFSSFFPFKYFNNHVMATPKPGILFRENFNNKTIFKSWSDLWMREAGTVTKEFSADGCNGSRCLLIKSSSTESWAYSHKTMIQVKRGDIYHFEGFVNIQGQNMSASLSVAAFDSNKRAIEWSLEKEKVNKYNTWTRVAKQFAIASNEIKYIKFRLGGKGTGEFRFDDITFYKLK